MKCSQYLIALAFLRPLGAFAQAPAAEGYACPLDEPAAIAIAEPLDSGGWTTGGAFDEPRPIGVDARRNRLMARHFGLDLSTTTGKAVTAVKPGRVVAAGKWLHLGNTVVVEHAAREYSVYAYLGTLSVAEGAAVAAGTPLGTAGFSGDAESVHRTNATSAPRLHFALISGRRTGLAGVGQPLRLFSTSADAWLPDMDSVATPVNPVTRLPSRCFRSSKP